MLHCTQIKGKPLSRLIRLNRLTISCRAFVDPGTFKASENENVKLHIFAMGITYRFSQFIKVHEPTNGRVCDIHNTYNS